MTELKPPRNGKPGTYRVMHQGKYRWFKAMSKDQALIQFKADQERATAEKVRQTKTLEYAQSQLEANGLGAYGEAISQIMDSNPYSPLHNHGDWSGLLKYAQSYIANSKTPTPDDFAYEVADGAGLKAEIEYNKLRILAQPEPKPEPKPKTRTIRQAIDSFLARQAANVNAGAIGAGRYQNCKRYLDHFADFYGPSKSASGIDELCLEEYGLHILSKTTGDKPWSRAYASMYLKALRQFVRWAWSLRLIEDLPRNIDRSEVKITVETEEVKVWPIAAVQAVMGFIPKRSERLKLYMLLMLNCGMTQKDISDLEPDQVDWQAHTITRKRSKTQDCKNVPTVTYPLWDSTFALLEKYGNKTGERVLTNGRGSPLKVVTLMGKKVVNVDIIGTMYGKFRKRCQEAGVLTESPTLKMFRKTSHSLIGNAPNDTWATYKVYFLGHAPMTVADKHYFRLDQAEFAKAIQWLGETLGVCSQP
jgi:integrase